MPLYIPVPPKSVTGSLTERYPEQVMELIVGCSLFAAALSVAELASNVPYFKVILT
jgi:hypothetical protein